MILEKIQIGKIILILLFFFCGKISAEPRIKINRINIDLGKVKMGSIVTNSSCIIKNRGDRPLTIKLHSTCECLSFLLDRFILQSNEQAPITIIMDTDNERGIIKEIFYIETNDPSYKIIPISVKVNAK